MVGHVEWIEFGRFTHVPEPGEIIDATEWFSEAAGGAAVVGVQLAKLSGDVDFFTDAGHGRARPAARRSGSTELGVRVHAAPFDAMQRWGFVHLHRRRRAHDLDRRRAARADGEDDLPWERLDGADASSSPAAMTPRCARRGVRELLVATPRAVESLAGVRLDALIGPARTGSSRSTPTRSTRRRS